MAQLEHYEQVSIVEWFKYQYPQALIYSIPNSATRSIRQTMWLRAEGLSAGVPDLCVPMPKGEYHGMYIEVKVGKNKPTEAQKKWLEKLTAQGYFCSVVYGFGEAQKIIKFYMELS